MKKIIYPALLAFTIFSCQKKDIKPVQQISPAQPSLIPRTGIDDFIKKTVLQTGRFDWSKASDEQIWSALQNSEKILSVGFKPVGVDKDISKQIHEVDIAKGEWASAKSEVLKLVISEEKLLNKEVSISNIEAYEENTIPAVYVWIENINTIKKLRASNLIRYAEPMGYEPQGFYEDATASNAKLTSSSGCGSNVAESGLVNNIDYTTIAPNAKQSWNFAYHNISQAWEKSTGGGIKIVIIDGGVSSSQSLFSSNFNNGYSSGRTIEKKVTLRKSAWFGLSYGSVETSTNDDCGHGTSMAGAAAGPRTSLGSNVGVAYNANLVTIRASTDVLIDESREAKGVTDAFVLAGNTSDAKIISMSMGRITSSGSISDAIDYAYNKGKLIFCAGGTSFGWSAGWFGVVFPATKSNVNAVTGVKDNFSRCNTCHDGSEIDFTVVMEKASNERSQLSVAQSGYAPSTVGGSSVATATTSGIAALVWSRYPSLTREQVLNKLIQNSSSYPNKSSSLGWGRINADLATD